MNAPHRRGWCPGLSEPMATGDGLLARLTPSGATIALEPFAGLCAAARTHGNGIVEITSRGSIQVRGLSAASAPAFAAAVAALGIASQDGVPLLTDPLSGLDAGGSFDAGALAADVRCALAAAPFAARLAAKLSVTIDGGGAMHLDGVAADVRLRTFTGPDEAPAFHVALGGDAATAIALGAVAPVHAAQCVVRLLALLAERAPHARMRDVVCGDGLHAFKSAVADMIVDAPAPLARPAAQPIGVHLLRSGQFAVGVGLPFGHAESEALQRLVAAAGDGGASGLRTAPGRALLVLGLPADKAQEFGTAAASLGFIVKANDPRRRVIACAGAPICASGEIPARTMAPAIAQAVAALPEAMGIVHVSGCAKGCAHPGQAPIAMIGRAGGCDVFVDGAFACSVPVTDAAERIAGIIRARVEAAHG